MTGIVETSVLQILGSSYYFPVVSSHALALVSLLPAPVLVHHNNAEFISESSLSPYAKPKYVYWKSDGEYKSTGLP